MDANPQTLPRTYRDVIDLWRTRAALARVVGVKPGLVRQWYKDDNIPEKRFLDVAEAAAICGKPQITYAVLEGLTPGKAVRPVLTAKGT